MKPTLGWTMLSREEMRQAERLTSGDQDTRDEIGFLLIHQGFADRFFPGTSVLHTRVRYALFVPWLFQHAAENKPRGSDLNAAIRRDMIRLAIRLKKRERYDVIGGDVLGRLSSQPPDQVYWTALKLWGILLSGINTRSEALRRLQASVRKAPLDDDGGSLDEDATEVFSSLPKPPTGWDNPESELDFKMSPREQDYLRRKLGLLRAPETLLNPCSPGSLRRAIPIPQARIRFRGHWMCMRTPTTSRRSRLRGTLPRFPRLAVPFMGRWLSICALKTAEKMTASFAQPCIPISMSMQKQRLVVIWRGSKPCCPPSRLM
jgi:hypothetical protein